MVINPDSMELVTIVLSYIITITVAQNAAVVSNGDVPVFRGDFCEGETFEAKCGEDEAIVMISAKYGRMGLGRCITISLGNLGCHLSVMNEFDQWCSGRRECQVRVSSVYDNIPDERQPCSREVRSYLEASYTCVKVITPSTQQCLAAPRTVISSPVSGFLSSMVTEETGCGSLDSPWQIKLGPGQRMRITMYDFNTKMRLQSGLTGKNPKICHVYAVIKEDAVSSRETVCGSTTRQSQVYTSLSNTVDIRFVAKRKGPDEGYFLMRYEAIGCAELRQPTNGWLIRHGDAIEAGCNNTDERWKLKCEDGVWIGKHRNCSSLAAASTYGSAGNGAIMGLLSGSQWAAIVIIAAIAVTLGLIIFLVGLVYLRRRRLRITRRTSSTRDRIPDYYAQQAIPAPSSDLFPTIDYSSKLNCNPDSSGYMTSGSAENDYFRTWQMQRHPGVGTPRIVQAPFTPRVPDTGPGQHVVEHIYESPKFERKHIEGENVQYYELDPHGDDSGGSGSSAKSH